MKLIAIFLLTLLSYSSYSQADSSKINSKDTFETVQVEAQFPGGPQGWRTYLEQTLKTDLIEKCVKLKKGQKTAKQTVIVSFRVDREGNISNVVAENGSEVCPRLAAEAIRVIKNGPKWIPATQNGETVIYRQRQSITWVLSED
jgi:periplasmic protein TonB